jgi:hypothetical protein
MPPKTQFTIPMGDSVNVVTTARRSKRDIRTTEKVAPIPSTKQKKLGKASGSRRQAEAIEASNQSQNTEEVHTLQLIDAQDAQQDDIQDFGTEERHSQSNVCATTSSCKFISPMICRHRWINGYNTGANIFIFYWRWKD